jgi:hypothetical protein
VSVALWRAAAPPADIWRGGVAPWRRGKGIAVDTNSATKGGGGVDKHIDGHIYGEAIAMKDKG